MKVIIIEDEVAAYENLIYLLHQINPDIEIVKILDGVRSAVDYFNNNNEADLVFMDVHLGDGMAFEIFEAVEIQTPIIFITAYDQYAIKAFKVNSVDYPLKPVQKEELGNAIAKFHHRNSGVKTNLNLIHQALAEIKQEQKKYKETFLVHKRESMIPIETINIAYFYISSGLVKGNIFDDETFILNRKLEDLEEELDSALFYRVNRQFIVHRKAIRKIHYGFNGKHTLSVSPKLDEPIVISKAKSAHFKEWVSK